MADAAEPYTVCSMWWLYLFKEKLHKLLVTSSHYAVNTDLLPTVNFLIFCFNTGRGDKGSSCCLGLPLLELTKKGDNSVPYKFAKECQQPKESCHSINFLLTDFFFVVTTRVT